MPPLRQPARVDRAPDAAGAFVLYVEGPRDRDILGGWAWRHGAHVARTVLEAAVILGGRQPQRAVEHFRRLRADDPGAWGLCVLDRDDAPDPTPPEDEPGLAFYIWGRRHIESYLLVPEVLRRGARSSRERFRLDRALREHLPDPADEAALRDLDAKRILSREGALARALGRPIPVGRMARSMRPPEIHDDVRDLLARIEEGVSADDA